MLVTAYPHPMDAGGHEVILKPFDLDELVGRVRRRLAAGNGKTEKPRPPIAPPPPARRRDDGDALCPQPIELILYVSAQSPRSASAIANIRQALSRYESHRVDLTIWDLSEDPSRGIADSIAFTPTLVKRSPGPRTFILGHITNPDLVLELLDGCD